jgi:hypothetical protein
MVPLQDLMQQYAVEETPKGEAKSRDGKTRRASSHISRRLDGVLHGLLLS